MERHGLTPNMNWIQLVRVFPSSRMKTRTPPIEATMASMIATYPMGTIHES